MARDAAAVEEAGAEPQSIPGSSASDFARPRCNATDGGLCGWAGATNALHFLRSATEATRLTKSLGYIQLLGVKSIENKKY